MSENDEAKQNGVDMADFEDYMTQATRRGTDEVPGCILRAKNSDGETVYSKCFGYNGIAPDAPPVEPDATLWVASFTKLLTAICCLQLYEQGLVDFDAPVGEVLPELANPEIVHLDDSDGKDSSVRLEPAKNKITLRHLLTHTSGLPYEFNMLHKQITIWRKSHPLRANSIGTVTALYNTPLVFEPGTSWAYGSGSDWAGQLVERVNPDKLPLGGYVRKNIFGRLGPDAGRDTTFRLDSPEAGRARIEDRWLKCVRRSKPGDAAAAENGEARPFVEDSNVLAREVEQESGGAGLYSTVGDYMDVLVDIISPSPKLLRVETVERFLYGGCVPADPPGPLRALSRSQTGMAPEGDDVAGLERNYSMGGMLWTRDGEVLPEGTLTWGGLPNLKWMANRRRGLCAVYASQVKPPSDPKSQALAAKFFKEVWRNFGGK